MSGEAVYLCLVDGQWRQTHKDDPQAVLFHNARGLADVVYERDIAKKSAKHLNKLNFEQYKELEHIRSSVAKTIQLLEKGFSAENKAAAATLRTALAPECKWVADPPDAYGKSWHCDTCGKCVFYQYHMPINCIKDKKDVPINPWWEPPLEPKKEPEE